MHGDDTMGDGNNGNTISELSKLIPEVYFDLICRLTPGAMFVFGAIFICQIPLGDEWYHTVPGLLFASYFAGFVLDAFSHFCSEGSVNKIMLWYVKKATDNDQKQKISKRCNLDERLNDTDRSSRAKAFEILRADLRHSSPDNTPVMGKLVAESRLLISSAFGLPIFIIMIWLINSNGECQVIDTRILLSAVILEIMLVLGCYQRIKRSALRAVFRWLKECT
jgi:hypothetical protein